MSEKLLTVAQLCERHPAFSIASLRSLLWRRHENGLAKAVRMVGRRVLLDERSFIRWIETDAANASRPYRGPKVQPATDTNNAA